MAIAAYAPIFYLKAFPNFKNEFSVAHGTAFAFCGLASSL